MLLVGFLVCTPLWAQQPAGPDGERPTVRALRLNVDEKIVVDGSLDEVSWERAKPITDFRQFEPKNGQPPTERSEIRIMFDRDNLYIGASFFDSNPREILGNQMVRDGALGADDRFMWVLDPFLDLRSGYFFEVNPAGAMGDAQLVANNISFGLVQNRAWNGVWLARVRRSDDGWTVEVEIPFRTLNFNPNSDEWGANFERVVRRKNEEICWSACERNQGLFSLAFSGRIVGVSDVSQGHGLDIKPYLLGTYTEAPNRDTSPTYKANEGVDFSFNVTPQLKTNFTLNTDFAQTEVDDRQVTLTRFPIFSLRSGTSFWKAPAF